MRSLILVFCALLALPAGAQTTTTLDTIRKQGVIRLGYVDGAAPFSWANANGEPQGYSVDLCRAVVDSIAEQLKRKELKVRWVKLTLHPTSADLRFVPVAGNTFSDHHTVTCR